MNKEELLTNEELAGIFKVKKETVRSWKNRNQIPEEVMFKLPGTKKGTVRFIRSKVMEWINGTLTT